MAFWHIKIVQTAACLSILVSLPAAAQNDAAEMIQILNHRPAGLTTEAWQKQRREAVRELGRSKDTRAVPDLLQIIAKERFDVVLELAIDALGDIGDKRALGSLRRLLSDPAIDAYVRDAVFAAVQKIEQRVINPGGTGSTASRPYNRYRRKTPAADEPVVLHVPATQPKQASNNEATTENQLPDDVHPVELPSSDTTQNLLGLFERFEVLTGQGQVAWQNVLKKTTAGFDLSMRYRRQVEKTRIGYTIDTNLSGTFSIHKYADRPATWHLQHSGQLYPELRYYPFRSAPNLFGQINGGFGYDLTAVQDAGASEQRLAFASTLLASAGIGYGRLLDIGATIRLKLLRNTLQKARLINKRIDTKTSNQILQTWAYLRGRIGSYDALQHTLHILRQRQILSDQPIDVDVTYRLIRVLEDPQLGQRWNGTLLRMGYGYAHAIIKDTSDTNAAFVYATTSYNRVIDQTSSVQTNLRSSWSHLHGHTFVIGYDAAYHYDMYSAHHDPLGRFSIGISLGVGNQPNQPIAQHGIGLRSSLRIEYSKFWGAASNVNVGCEMTSEQDAIMLLFGLRLNQAMFDRSYTQGLTGLSE